MLVLSAFDAASASHTYVYGPLVALVSSLFIPIRPCPRPAPARDRNVVLRSSSTHPSRAEHLIYVPRRLPRARAFLSSGSGSGSSGKVFVPEGPGFIDK